MTTPPSGFCQCGCGKTTALARHTITSRGQRKGHPVRFISGHNSRGRHRSLAARLFQKVRKADCDGCWYWMGAKQQGYGIIVSRNGGRSLKAHRVSFELLVGTIPDGLTLDHLCRNRACVNPSHLEPVTARENTLRGFGVYRRNSRKTHCVNGHAFSSENTIRRKNGGRRCRTCKRERGTAYRRKKGIPVRVRRI